MHGLPAEHMNGEQLDGRETYFEAEIAKLKKERDTRITLWTEVQAKKAHATLAMENTTAANSTGAFPDNP